MIFFAQLRFRCFVYFTKCFERYFILMTWTVSLWKFSIQTGFWKISNSCCSLIRDVALDRRNGKLSIKLSVLQEFVLADKKWVRKTLAGRLLALSIFCCCFYWYIIYMHIEKMIILPFNFSTTFNNFLFAFCKYFLDVCSICDMNL